MQTIRIGLLLSEEEYERFEEIGRRLNSRARKRQGPKESLPVTSIFRDMLQVTEEVLDGYPAIVRDLAGGVNGQERG